MKIINNVFLIKNIILINKLISKILLVIVVCLILICVSHSLLPTDKTYDLKNYITIIIEIGIGFIISIIVYSKSKKDQELVKQQLEELELIMLRIKKREYKKEKEEIENRLTILVNLKDVNLVIKKNLKELQNNPNNTNKWTRAIILSIDVWYGMFMQASTLSFNLDFHIHLMNLNKIKELLNKNNYNHSKTNIQKFIDPVMSKIEKERITQENKLENLNQKFDMK